MYACSGEGSVHSLLTVFLVYMTKLVNFIITLCIYPLPTLQRERMERGSGNATYCYSHMHVDSATPFDHTLSHAV